MTTTTLIIYFSCSNKNAAINVFLYLASMNFNFYFLQSVFEIINSQSGDVYFINWGLLNTYNIIALACALVGFVLYYWNKQSKLSSLLYALPISGLLAETIGVSIYLYNYHTFLGQFVFDFLSFIALGYWFYKKANNKFLYIITVIIVSSIGYFLVYHSFL
ncbi:putative membrane protein [Clostridium bornimense]|uniref:Putative membrane protein n=1 Tax=Clostridium bornimense TaxID=1216932 RepID=W6S1V4_9CLOT|nr:putative membrane protein [Clostridium bornimense]